MSLRRDSNPYSHSWPRDFPTTLAFTQANLFGSLLATYFASRSQSLGTLRDFLPYQSCCGLDYFITLLINFEVRN